MNDINEISKETLASYKAKSSADFDRASKQDDTKRMYKRGKGLLRATGKQMDISHQEYLAKKKQNEETNMDNILENIADMIDAIETGNSFDAEKMFDQIMMTKIDNAISQKKIEVANSMFNTQECVDCEEEIEEEVEQIDELQKSTYQSYVKKATKSADRHQRKSDEREDRAMSMDGSKYPQQQQAHIDAATKHHKMYAKRKAGIRTARAKMSEELKGDQHKIDANKNGKLDAQDFKMLRKKKKSVSEAAVSAGKRPMDPAAAKAAYQAERQRRQMQQASKPQASAVAPKMKAKKVRSPEEEKARQLAKADMKAMRKSNG